MDAIQKLKEMPTRLCQPAARKIRILLVDDNPGDVGLLRLALKDAEFNCQLTVMDNGAAALAFIGQPEQHTGVPTPDLVVLDLHLPKNDGLEILEAMSKARVFTNIPVVVMSSGSSPCDLVKIQQFNVARYITKPSTLEEFLAIGLTLKALVQRGSYGECRHDGNVQ